jgi:hypothetical protein
VTAEPADRNLGGGSIREAYLLEALAKDVETHLLLAGSLDDQRTRSVLAGVTEVDIASRPLPRGRCLACLVAAAGADHARDRFAWDTIGRRFVDTLLELVQRQAR